MLNGQKVSPYYGSDSTADSLRISHLLPVLALHCFQQVGRTPITLIDDTTGMTGDPSFKATERSLNSAEIVADWVESIRSQLTPFLNFEDDNAAVMTNNANWFGSVNCLNLLRDVSKYFSVNAIPNKEPVKQRIKHGDVGISFTRFAYSLLQGYDFIELNRRHGVALGTDGPDQWGSITAGIDLTRHLYQKQVFSLTLPLIIKSDDTRFGKTEGGVVWLSTKKTSPYQFYQSWLKVADVDMRKLLKYFTFPSIEETGAIEAKGKANGTKLEVQRILTGEMTRLIHGEEILAAIQRIFKSLFVEDRSHPTESDLKQLALDGLPTFGVSENLDVVGTLVKTGLASSSKGARDFINGKTVLLGNKPVEANNPSHTAEKPNDACMLASGHKRLGKYTIVRCGERNHALLVWK